MNTRREKVGDIGRIEDRRAVPLSIWDTIERVVPKAESRLMVTPLFSPNREDTISRRVFLSES